MDLRFPSTPPLQTGPNPAPNPKTQILKIVGSRRVLVLLLLCSFALPMAARSARKSTVKIGKPGVQEVSPPNWWSDLPDPMLLLRGNNLAGVQVAASAPGISVRRTKVSANGHWAFVWLDISGAQPQKFDLLLHNASGKTAVHYELDQRHAPTDGFQGFTSADVMYLAMPDRFSDGDTANDRLPQMSGTFDPTNRNAYHGGDLAGIENHLDYLQELGVTTLWITPIYTQDSAAPQDYSGYAPVDLYRINPHFGTLQDYQNLAQELHRRNMKFVLDVIMNHVGPKSPWVTDPPTPDWFHGTPEKHLEANVNFVSITDPHAPPAEERPAVDGWLGNTMPDLNQSNPLVKQYLIQNAIWWIESGALDGLRLDTFAHVDRAFWQEFHSVLRALYPHLTTVGEIFNPDPTIVSYFAGGVKRAGIDTGLYTPFDFPTYFGLRAALTGTSVNGGPISSLADIQRHDWLYPHPERLVTFFGNQDTSRFLSEPGSSTARMKMAFGLVATMRGMPQIYYGDEIGMSAGNNSDNRLDFPGGFPGDSANAFIASGRTAQQEEMHAWVEGLLQLRAHHEVLQSGAQQNLFVDDNGFVFTRFMTPSPGHSAASSEAMVVLMNKAATPRTFHLDFSNTALVGVQGLSPVWNTNDQVTVQQNLCDVTVAPEQLIVLNAQR